MALIEISELCKSFAVKESGRGVKGRLKGLFAPQVRTFDAVKGLSLTVESGEIVGFIGPNGAGKSTTIKMLTGILHPTSGHVRVCGFTPWEERKQLAYSLGTVFGQRPQLWYHLPALDTLFLFGKIYGKSNKETQNRISHLAEVLDCKDLLNVPVRKLSLGQRMRCELIASLIHSPQLLLLDEPSIGLDVVSKTKLRSHIKRLNEEEGVTVLLTSHDTADLEALCSRVVVINHGQVIYQNSLEAMKRDLLSHKVIEVCFETEVPHGFSFADSKIVNTTERSVQFEIDMQKYSVESVVTSLAGLPGLADLNISHPPLEEIIKNIFERQLS